MIERMAESDGRTIGFRAIGSITKDDYKTLSEQVGALVDREGSIALLIDLEQFEGEGPSAWGADLDFGRTYRHKIDRMAIVGDHSWQSLLAKLAEPFYARESKYFDVAARADAWAWLRQAK
jgi:SpoIIAA-like